MSEKAAVAMAGIKFSALGSSVNSRVRGGGANATATRIDTSVVGTAGVGGTAGKSVSGSASGGKGGDKSEAGRLRGYSRRVFGAFVLVVAVGMGMGMVVWG